MLDINQLSRQLDGQTVLAAISAQLQPGQVVALVGKNGSGKTTLLHTLLGFALPDSGQVTLWGQPAAECSGAIRQRIGFVPQQDDLLEQLTVAQHLRLFSQFYPDWDNTLAQRLLVEWELPAKQPIARLSLGQRQKLSIVLALAHQPELLVLDEPAASLDPLARRQLLTELIEIAATEQTAILYSSHLVGDLERIASHVWLLQQGRLTVNAELDALKENIWRLQLTPGQPVPAIAGLRQLSLRSAPGYQTLTVQQLVAGALPQLLAALQPLHTEQLGLEEIFLELHA
jgi:ABC-2 type transport system ATP-binding protein